MASPFAAQQLTRDKSRLFVFAKRFIENAGLDVLVDDSQYDGDNSVSFAGRFKNDPVELSVEFRGSGINILYMRRLADPAEDGLISRLRDDAVLHNYRFYTVSRKDGLYAQAWADVEKPKHDSLTSFSRACAPFADFVARADKAILEHYPC